LTEKKNLLKEIQKANNDLLSSESEIVELIENLKETEGK